MCNHSAQLFTTPQSPTYAVPMPLAVGNDAAAHIVKMKLVSSTVVAVAADAATPNFHPCSRFRFSLFDRAVVVLDTMLIEASPLSFWSEGERP